MRDPNAGRVKKRLEDSERIVDSNKMKATANSCNYVFVSGSLYSVRCSTNMYIGDCVITPTWPIRLRFALIRFGFGVRSVVFSSSLLRIIIILYRSIRFLPFFLCCRSQRTILPVVCTGHVKASVSCVCVWAANVVMPVNADGDSVFISTECTRSNKSFRFYVCIKAKNRKD